MALVSKLDEFGRAGWIVAVVLGFWLWWPVGLALLLYMVFSGRMRGGHEAPGRWYNTQTQGSGSERGNPWGNWGGGWGCGGWGRGPRVTPSGNRAFDEYRAETLRRLEEEAREFAEYLERLRQARDKAEFDGFMAERRRRTQTPDAPEPDHPQG